MFSATLSGRELVMLLVSTFKNHLIQIRKSVINLVALQRIWGPMFRLSNQLRLDLLDPFDRCV